MADPPSGEQFQITLGDQRATVVEVGGGIREYVVGHRQLDPERRRRGLAAEPSGPLKAIDDE